MQGGDTLRSIALEQGVHVYDLMVANNLTDSFEDVYEGKALTIPCSGMRVWGGWGVGWGTIEPCCVMAYNLPTWCTHTYILLHHQVSVCYKAHHASTKSPQAHSRLSIWMGQLQVIVHYTRSRKLKILLHLLLNGGTPTLICSWQTLMYVRMVTF